MIIGVDCRLAGQKHAGIGRYIANLIRQLPKLAPNDTFYYFFSQAGQQREFDFSQFKNVRSLLTPIKHYSLAEQWRLPWFYRHFPLDLLHVPHFNAPIFYQRPFVITIHDLLWHEHRGPQVTTLPIWQYHLKYRAYLLVSGQAIKKAAKIFVPSQTIKETVGKFYPFAKEKIIVTPEGVEEVFFQPLAKAGRRRHRELLYVGSLYPHKNVDLVLRALRHLSDWRLLIVGSRDVFLTKISHRAKELKVDHQVEFLGKVDDRRLRQLYGQTAALVQPSLSEGFGLTGLEAMASGALVLAAKTAIFQEVYGSRAVYFDPLSVADFLRAVKRISLVDRRQQQWRNRNWARRFSWRKMARQTYRGYQAALENN